MSNKKNFALSLITSILISLIAFIPVFAQNNNVNTNNNSQSPVVLGNVSAINGNILTVIGRQMSNITRNGTFTVDAIDAQIIKGGKVTTISNLSIGDMVIISGTLSGTKIKATSIREAQSNNTKTDPNQIRPNVVGKVSAINGSVLTVISKQGFNKTFSKSPTTFTIDAKSAKILRGNTAILVSDIVVGDTVIIQGNITGTNITATVIRDGKVGEGDNDQALYQIEENGQPVVFGEISAISGFNLTVANSGDIVYSVDASNAKVFIPGKTNSSLSDLSSGDRVMIQGTVNGNSIKASLVVGQKAPGFSVGSNQEKDNKNKLKAGFFNNAWNFFKRIFKFW